MQQFNKIQFKHLKRMYENNQKVVENAEMFGPKLCVNYFLTEPDKHLGLLAKYWRANKGNKLQKRTEKLLN